MKLPWVSRRALELSQHNNQQLRLLVKEHADERYGSLLIMYHELALRVSSPSAPVGILDAIVPVPRVRSVVGEAIKAQSEGDPRLARYLSKRAQELKAENKRPEEIALELANWQTTEVSDD